MLLVHCRLLTLAQRGRWYTQWYEIVCYLYKHTIFHQNNNNEQSKPTISFNIFTICLEDKLEGNSQSIDNKIDSYMKLESKESEEVCITNEWYMHVTAPWKSMFGALDNTTCIVSLFYRKPIFLDMHIVDTHV